MRHVIGCSERAAAIGGGRATSADTPSANEMAAAGLDMSLDEIIDKAPGGGKGKGGGKGFGGRGFGKSTSHTAMARSARRGGSAPYASSRPGKGFGGGGGGGGGGGTSVYVGNLSWEVSWQDLKDHFKQVGPVMHADVMMEPGSTRSKGCGIVTFNNARDAKTAIQTLHDTDLKGRLIFVREDREGGGGGAMGGGKGGGGGGAMGGTSVYVGNLSWEVSWQDLKDHFKQVGPVLHADVMLEPGSTRSKGCGLVTFQHPRDAAKAIQTLHDTDLKGRLIFVREDREGGGAPAPMGGGGGGGFGGGAPAESGCSVYVGNLATTVTWKNLKDLFRGAGIEVVRADVAERHDGVSKGFGTVLLGSTRDAAKAIQLFNETAHNGRVLEVRPDAKA